MSEAIIIALTSAAGILFGYVLRVAELAAKNKVTVQRNAIEGFSDLCEKLTARLATVEQQLTEAQRRITQLEAEIASLQHANHILRLKIDDTIQQNHGPAH
jgi:septal ring factor EnvC (AmiA/AmiB activator)